MSIKRIAVIGNGGGGKSTLSRALAKLYDLPITHVDSIQFLAGMKVRPAEETRALLEEIAATPRWLIDGFGSLAVMQKRFELADIIIFIDFPLWRHYWWCTKRQLKSIWKPRPELPDGCDEATVAHTIRLYKILWRVHVKIRPELLSMFELSSIKSKVLRINSVRDWKSIFNSGIVQS